MKYDAIVIGAGPGGYPAAIRLAQLGKKTLIVEKNAVGGVCLNRGCIPTKALAHAAEVRHSLANYQRMGLGFKDSGLDFPKLQRWKNATVTRLVKGIEFLFKSNGVELMTGIGRIVEPEVVEVRTKDESIRIQTDSIILATGSTPVPLPHIKPDNKAIFYAEDALFFTEIPSSMLIVGAGATGMEMATIYNTFGAKLTVVEIMKQIQPGLDAELAENLAKLIKKQSIELMLSSKVTEVEKLPDTLKVSIQTPDGKIETREVEKLLLSVGRKAVTEELWDKALAIDIDMKGFIKVNEKLETSVPGIYAIGDLTGPPLLAHRASKQGIIAAEVIAGKKSIYAPKAMPSCIYTIPNLASVGLSEQQAIEAGYKIEIGRFPYSALGRAATLGERDGFVKIIANKQSGKLLGMQVMGVGADTLIGEALIALELKTSFETLATAVHPHPTLLEAVMEAAENVKKRAIHIKN